MSKLRLLPIILLLALLIFSACGDDDPPTGSGGGNGDLISFPSAVGMLWKYEVYDSLTETVDTVWVSVTEMRESIAMISVYQWRLYSQKSGEVEDRVVLFWGDTVDIFTDSTQGDIEYLERFVTPFDGGTEWTGPNPGDTSRASYWRSLTVPAGTFTGVARVDRVWNQDFEGGGKWSETWLDEEAGILKRHFLSQYSDGNAITVTQNETWELVEYDLTTFSLQQFPNTIGTQWVYEVLDISSEVSVDTVGIDTVTVTIVNYLFPENIPAPWEVRMVWVFSGLAYTDTSIVQIAGNTVTVNYDTLQRIPPLPAWSYEFPMTVGKHWGFDTFWPIPQIFDKCSVSTPVGNFQTTFRYSMSGGMPGSWMVQDWLAPGVGVVKRVYTGSSATWPLSWREWTLLSVVAEW